eukprot:10138-Heterococcus_DN1.PRE.1
MRLYTDWRSAASSSADAWALCSSLKYPAGTSCSAIGSAIGSVISSVTSSVQGSVQLLSGASLLSISDCTLL